MRVESIGLSSQIVARSSIAPIRSARLVATKRVEAALSARAGTDSTQRFLRLVGSELRRAFRLARLLLGSRSEAKDATGTPVRFKSQAHHASGRAPGSGQIRQQVGIRSYSGLDLGRA